MKEALRKRLYTNIINTYGEYVTNPKDLIGDKDPSLLFFIFGKLFRELLVDGYASISTNSIKKKKKFNSIIRKVGKHFLSNPQIILDKNELIGITQNDIEKASFDKEEKYKIHNLWLMLNMYYLISIFFPIFLLKPRKNYEMRNML